LEKFVKDDKAESHLVATLLLIAVVVGASIITYSWVMSMVGSQSTQAQTQIRIDMVQWYNSTATKKLDATVLTIRNTGSVAATVESVSITLDQATVIATLSSKISIPTGQTAVYTFNAGIDGVPSNWTWSIQKSYVVRATTSTGFYYELVSSSPSTIPLAS
jgi:FlaG/FlaF family flagellin (archaellin)